MTPAAAGSDRLSQKRIGVTEPEQDRLSRAFAAYNAQDVEGLLALVSDDVDWPDGSRRLRGKDALYAYWTAQWARSRTYDQPTAFQRRPDGRVAVRLNQVVCSSDEAITSTGTFEYVFCIKGLHITRLDIEPV